MHHQVQERERDYRAAQEVLRHTPANERFPDLEDVRFTLATLAAAETKARQLLKDNLTPEQRSQLEQRGAFEVIGCDTGTRYRIKCYPNYNVHPLVADARALCFQPTGVPYLSDIMLAQKIALENYETDALAVANRRFW
jgi:hypothetical protein